MNRYPNRPIDTCTITGIDLKGSLCANDSGHSNIFVENVTGDISCLRLSARVGGGDPLARKFTATGSVVEILRSILMIRRHSASTA